MQQDRGQQIITQQGIGQQDDEPGPVAIRRWSPGTVAGSGASTARTGSAPGRTRRHLRRLLAVTLGVCGVVVLNAPGAQASTGRLRGVNWADTRDNFVNGVLYPSGLSPSDTYASAAETASQVVGQLYTITGGNTVRMPINEPTVADAWRTYTGAIDAALSQGNVILAYWAHSGGRPANTTSFYQMWDTVMAKYAASPNAYFEVINEPYGYSSTDLNNLYNAWLGRYPNAPRGRVILDGSGLATNVPSVGNDSRLNGTLLGVHDYTMFVGSPMDDETSWADHLAGEIGGFADRTVATEWGGPMRPGNKYNIQWDTIDYSIPSGSYFADYLRGISSRLRALGMGSVYWPGLRDNDWYSLTTRSGSGSGTKLSAVNPSGIVRLQYAWGIGNGGGTSVQIRNVSTGLLVDGFGRTVPGSSVGQSASSGSTDQQWVIELSGTYVRIKDRATGLYLDGMGRTANGSAVAQSPSSTSTSQQWSVLTSANNVRIKNRVSGLFLDGMGRGSGSDLGQYADSGSSAQQWKILAAG